VKWWLRRYHAAGGQQGERPDSKTQATDTGTGPSLGDLPSRVTVHPTARPRPVIVDKACGSPRGLLTIVPPRRVPLGGVS
jgi:hypothetical protein